jgi:protein ImuB
MSPLVMLDLSGLSRLFGSPREIGEQLRRSMAGAPVRIAIASSQTAAALIALGRVGLTVVSPEEQPAAIAPLSVTLLGELETLRTGERSTKPQQQHGGEDGSVSARNTPQASSNEAPPKPPHVGEMEDALPYLQSCLDRTSEAAREPHARIKPQVSSGGTHANCGGGWTHPRDAHAAKLAKRARGIGLGEAPYVASPRSGRPERTAPVLKDIQGLLDVLRRWGVKTLGALAALPAGDVYERLGARGVAWQRLARGEDQGPLVPCVPEEPFEGTLELEWPIEGLEPLSFVLARLFEPLSERLERADRGAAILHTHLRLTTRDVYARTIQLPAPMRDAKTLRTLALLDLESNPPPAAIDRVRVLVEPTPAKVLQWTLYERAQPSPEQVSTLLARLTALMGEGHVGSPALIDSWRPGAFQVTAFAPQAGATHASPPPASPLHPTSPPGVALRRFRLPVPARVQSPDGRPVRIMVDRRGVSGGNITQSAGPWRTSGEWWQDGLVGRIGLVGQVGGRTRSYSHSPDQPHPPYQPWDRDEWDVVLGSGAAYRIYVERAVGQWFIDGVID